MSEIRVRDLRNKTLIYQLLRSLLLCRSLTCSVSLRMYVGVQIFERGKLLFAHLLNSDHVLNNLFYEIQGKIQPHSPSKRFPHPISKFTKSWT